MPEWLMVFMTCDCIQMNMIRLGRNRIRDAAADVPAAATALLVDSDPR